MFCIYLFLYVKYEMWNTAYYEMCTELEVPLATLIFILLQEGGVTSERVVVLFFFCSDLAIRALRKNLRDRFDFITYCSQRYIMEKFSVWVQEHGGWV
jgi:hypothetical protein